jgi:hypothetical protein
MAKKVIKDVAKRTKRVVDFEHVPIDPDTSNEKPIDFEELYELITWAKKQGFELPVSGEKL